ncbi:MAG: YggS family pyridoxal phosphate-dependent enzyme [Chlamydiota bacterium]|nr:YggS family pyridoxal phosphate-dependent enzyme [Chlamydiota bacterium]
MHLSDVKICAVTKGHSVLEVEDLLKLRPDIKIIGENRWPDCEEKFKYFKELERHFIGPLQGNKVRKVLPLVDVIQSVDSEKLMLKIDDVALETEHPVKFCIQVNVSDDPAKHGVRSEELEVLIQKYLAANFRNITLIGLMTIGAQSPVESRAKYFAKFKKIFDHVNETYFKQSPLTVLSMGMSEDYKIAVKEGSTMIRLGRVLFCPLVDNC